MSKLTAIVFGAVLSLALSAMAANVASAKAAEAEDFAHWPGAEYDAAVPSVEDVLGYASGDRVTWPHAVIKYFEALQAAAPDRVVITEYARTWEGRPLIYVAISSPENIARLDQFSADMISLSDPRILVDGEAERLLASVPASVWLAYGVHGNEISSSDAAMMTAYHLLAATNDPRTTEILDNTIVFIDPMQNPDGRARFVHNFEIAEGLEPDDSRFTAEHSEPWPGGRTNHYLFDMNRDWIALTQPETRGRVAALQEYFPLVFVDLHEMGSDSSYYFAPEAVPFNPHLAADQRGSLELFGRNNAKWFDEFGFDYFTREVFDAFYPGYGASWPSYYGSVAMTYEQASARGLKMRRTDGTAFHYRDTVRHHFVTSLATAEVTSNNRGKLLRDFYNYRRSAIEEGRKDGPRSFIIPTQNDHSGAKRLASVMAEQGIEVRQADNGFRACGTSYEAGSFVIDAAQPAKRLIRTLLDEQVAMEKSFVAEQERRRAKNLRDEIYDVTGWALQLMFNVEVDTCNRAVNTSGDLVSGDDPWPGEVTGSANASVAYLVPWGSTAAGRFLTSALRSGLSVMSSDKAFTQEGRRYPAGTLIVEIADNESGLAQKIAMLALKSGAEVVGTDTSWISDGPNFGSYNVVSHPAPRVAILWDRPTSSYGAGNGRFVIERQFGYPVSAIRGGDLTRADLSRFDVLILPTGYRYAAGLGKGAPAKLKSWVEAGGVIISLGEATAYLADPEVDLLSIRRENAFRDKPENGKGSGAFKAKGEKGKPKPKTVAGSLIDNREDYLKSIEPKKEAPDSVAGVLVRADVDPDHWLGAGVAPSLNVLIRGRGIYTPSQMDKGRNVVTFADKETLLASGHLWQQNREQLAFKPFVVAEPKGRGFVIGFTQDPTVRAYLDGLNVILLNAIFRGSAHATPVR